MDIVYSTGVRLAGGGIGNIAHYAADELYANNMLTRLLCGSHHPRTKIPSARIEELGFVSRLMRKLAVYDKSRRIEHLYNSLYDNWASRHLEPCDVFYCWGNFCLYSLEAARRHGAITIVERASSHPRFQYRLLNDEYRRWGRRFRMPASALERAETEIQQADYIVIPSEFVRDSFHQEGIAELKLIQFPFGVDVERFQPAKTDRSDPFCALFVGQIGIRKGVPYLLEAWKQLGWDDAKLVLLGRISAGARTLLHLNTVSGVHHVGYVENPVSVYQQADVFVFPTIEEGSAMVTYEAMASGLPVITTPNAGSLVRDGEDGFIVPIRDVTALATRMEELRRQPQLRQQMGASARRRIEPFTWTRYRQTFVDTLTQLLP